MTDDFSVDDEYDDETPSERASELIRTWLTFGVVVSIAAGVALALGLRTDEATGDRDLPALLYVGVAGAAIGQVLLLLGVIGLAVKTGLTAARDT